MSQNHVGQRTLGVLCCLGLAALLPVGCNLLSSRLTSIDNNSELSSSAEYPLVSKEGPKKGQDVAVAVFVEYAPGTDFAFADSEGKLATELVKHLSEQAKKGARTIKVIDPARENSIDPKNPNWKLMYTGDWNQKHFVDFVLTVHLDQLAIYQPGSHNQFYQGEAEVTVNVDEVEGGNTKPKYHYVLPFRYPEAGTLDATAIPVTRFKQDFLEHLAAEVAVKHFGQKPASGITAVKPR